jgi:hypothetical protein
MGVAVVGSNAMWARHQVSWDFGIISQALRQLSLLLWYLHHHTTQLTPLDYCGQDAIRKGLVNSSESKSAFLPARSKSRNFLDRALELTCQRY